MGKYYFSGIDRTSFIGLLAREGGAGMVNALNATQPAMLAAYQRYPEVPLVLDSGAFQGNVDVAGYAEIVRQVGSRFSWVANLDVIGNQQSSDENWESLTEMGVKPLWVYQVQGGRGLDYLQERADSLRFVGVGGLVPVVKRNTGEAVEMIGRIGDILQHSGASAHFFGIGSPSVLSAYSVRSWFASADSQAWLCGFKSLEMIRRDGSRMKSDSFGLSLTGDECAAQNIRQVHGWMNGQPLQLAMM